MKLFTFTATSPAIALQKAQKACGRDALVVSTKQIQKKSLTSSALYELVIAVEDDIVLEKQTKRVKLKATFDDEVLDNISKTAKQLQRLERASDPLEQTRTQSNIEIIKNEQKNNEFSQLKNDIGLLSDKIKILQNMLWDEKEDVKELSIPPEFAEIYNKTKSSGMKKEHLDEIMSQSIKLMPAYMKNSTKTVKRYFSILLKKMIPTRIEKPISKGEKKIIMFVGSTGVGKTTTLAKLAAKYSFLKHKNRVGIITLDTYRIGALEQMFHYAKMMKLPVQDVIDSADFKKALNSLLYCDLILIDTAGSSQHDKEKILKISNFLKSTEHKIDVSLVLSATSKLQDLEDAYKNFSFLDIDTLIFTKLDETRNFGNIFSLIKSSGKPTSYFSTGQEVPDDIQEATGDFLVSCIFEGFVNKKVYS